MCKKHSHQQSCLCKALPNIEDKYRDRQVSGRRGFRNFQCSLIATDISVADKCPQCPSFSKCKALPNTEQTLRPTCLAKGDLGTYTGVCENNFPFT